MTIDYDKIESNLRSITNSTSPSPPPSSLINESLNVKPRRFLNLDYVPLDDEEMSSLIIAEESDNNENDCVNENNYDDSNIVGDGISNDTHHKTNKIKKEVFEEIKDEKNIENIALVKRENKEEGIEEITETVKYPNGEEEEKAETFDDYKEEGEVSSFSDDEIPNNNDGEIKLRKRRRLYSTSSLSDSTHSLSLIGNTPIIISSDDKENKICLASKDSGFHRHVKSSKKHRRSLKSRKHQRRNYHDYNYRVQSKKSSKEIRPHSSYFPHYSRAKHARDYSRSEPTRSRSHDGACSSTNFQSDYYYSREEDRYYSSSSPVMFKISSSKSYLPAESSSDNDDKKIKLNRTNIYSSSSEIQKEGSPIAQSPPSQTLPLSLSGSSTFSQIQSTPLSPPPQQSISFDSSLSPLPPPPSPLPPLPLSPPPSPPPLPPSPSFTSLPPPPLPTLQSPQSIHPLILPPQSTQTSLLSTSLIPSPPLPPSKSLISFCDSVNEKRKFNQDECHDNATREENECSNQNCPNKKRRLNNYNFRKLILSNNVFSNAIYSIPYYVSLDCSLADAAIIFKNLQNILENTLANKNYYKHMSHSYNNRFLCYEVNHILNTVSKNGFSQEKKTKYEALINDCLFAIKEWFEHKDLTSSNDVKYCDNAMNILKYSNVWLFTANCYIYVVEVPYYLNDGKQDAYYNVGIIKDGIGVLNHKNCNKNNLEALRRAVCIYLTKNKQYYASNFVDYLN